MDKKKKFSFFDLSDDSFFNHEEEINNSKNNNKNDDIKTMQTKEEVIDNENLNKNVDTNLNNSERNIPEEKEEIISERNIPEEKEEIIITNKEAFVKDNLYPKVEEFVDKKIEQQDNQEINISSYSPQINNNKENNFNDKNIDYNEENLNKNIKEKENINLSQVSNINVNTRIRSLFDVEEKLDIKTNIYIKKWIYNEVEQIHLNTGKSRSAVINKLLEYALKGVK